MVEHSITTKRRALCVNSLPGWMHSSSGSSISSSRDLDWMPTGSSSLAGHCILSARLLFNIMSQRWICIFIICLQICRHSHRHRQRTFPFAMRRATGLLRRDSNLPFNGDWMDSTEGHGIYMLLILLLLNNDNASESSCTWWWRFKGRGFGEWMSESELQFWNSSL